MGQTAPNTFNLGLLIAIVFIISWLGVLPGILLAYGVAVPSSLKRFDILMTLGPLIGAVIFLFKSGGKNELKNFFGRLLRFKAAPGVIFITVFLPVLVSLLGAFIGLRLSKSIWPESFDPVSILTNGLMIFLMYLFINTEELVWRGIVFDRFLNKHGYFKSCLIVIPIWWLFHIPLFLYPEGHPAGYGLGIFTYFVIAQTFILGWIYVKSNRSLFYVHIHHQLINGFGQAFPIFPIFIAGNKTPVTVFSVLLIFVAIILIIQIRNKELKT